jgi:hypothetical protein
MMLDSRVIGLTFMLSGMTGVVISQHYRIKELESKLRKNDNAIGVYRRMFEKLCDTATPEQLYSVLLDLKEESEFQQIIKNLDK